jgi:hypothetical protein
MWPMDLCGHPQEIWQLKVYIFQHGTQVHLEKKCGKAFEFQQVLGTRYSTVCKIQKQTLLQKHEAPAGALRGH